MENKETENYYELIFILNSNISLKDFDITITRIKNKLNTNNSILLKENYYGIRPLTYEIKKQKNGYYILFEFKITANTYEKALIIDNIKKQVVSDNNVIKFIISKISKEGELECYL